MSQEMNRLYVWDDVVIYVSIDCLETGSMKKVEPVGTWWWTILRRDTKFVRDELGKCMEAKLGKVH